MRKTIPILLFVVSLPLRAQTPYLVKDINTTYSNATKSSSPTEFVAFGNRIFFAATTDAAGTELWSTDGTSGGTSMVADIIPGTGSSSPSGLTVVNGVLLFNARDVNHGIELWTSDGTAAGTHLLVDINPGPTSSQPLSRIVYKNTMLFSADDGTNGRELWTTDGTAAGTRMLKDISPGSAASSPAYFVAMGGSVYFSAAGGLWKTDGTESGTVNVVSVVAVRNLAAAGSQLFFEGFTSAAGWEPWVSDGTSAGTHMVTDILPGAGGSLNNSFFALGFTPFGNQVLFLANDGVHGREMWISDGTAAGTRMVRDFVPGAIGMWDSAFAYITVLGNRAFFSASDSVHGRELWVTDGTDAGTAFFADLLPGPDSSLPFAFGVMNGMLFVGAGSKDAVGSQLWVTDGSVSGTHVISGMGGPGFGLDARLWPINGKIYFGGATALTGTEPWVTDGTAAGSRMIANLGADRTPSSDPFQLTATSNLLFFNATEGTISPTTGVAESSLWRSDGTEAGTFKLRETGQGPPPLTPAGPLVFFTESLNNGSTRQIVSDGTITGTTTADDFMRRFGAPGWGGAFFSFGDTLRDR
ncbi:MAG TPA: ELWxxDGT repeat protein [Thermoanaerobaculia bacterium]|jgi:ELWxxDGT repeat protein|nr:ELWxxDGT repeat protein [Thermoanaerobaculia bacterium]